MMNAPHRLFALLSLALLPTLVQAGGDGYVSMQHWAQPYQRVSQSYPGWMDTQDDYWKHWMSGGSSRVRETGYRPRSWEEARYLEELRWRDERAYQEEMYRRQRLYEEEMRWREEQAWRGEETWRRRQDRGYDQDLPGYDRIYRGGSDYRGSDYRDLPGDDILGADRRYRDSWDQDDWDQDRYRRDDRDQDRWDQDRYRRDDRDQDRWDQDRSGERMSTETFRRRELEAQRASLRDLEEEIKHYDDLLALDPDNRSLRGYRDGLRDTHAELERSIRELERNGGAGSEAAGIDYSTRSGSTVGWIRSEDAARNLGQIRAGILADPTGFPDGDPIAERKHQIFVLATDAVMDIQDPELRSRVYKAFILTLSNRNGGSETAFAQLLAVVSQVGYDRARVDHPEVEEALRGFFATIPSSQSANFLDPEATLTDLLKGRVSGARTFSSPIDFDVYRRAVSSILDGGIDPDSVPAEAEKEWQDAVRTTLVLQQALANHQIKGRDDASKRVLVDAWNRHVDAVQAYIRKYRDVTGKSPHFGSRGNVGFLAHGQQRPDDPRDRPLPPSTDPEAPPENTIPVRQAPGPDEATKLLERLVAHRSKMQKLLREVVALIEGERWEDYSDWAETFRFWEWGSAPDSPAEKVVHEIRTTYLHRTQDLDSEKSMVGLIREIAEIEREAVQQSWVFPTTDGVRKPNMSDSEWEEFTKGLDQDTRRLLAIGNFIIKARRDAFVVLTLSYRFERGDFDKLDETARGGNQEGEVKTLQKLFIKKEGDKPSFDGLEAALFLRQSIKLERRGKDISWNAATLRRQLDPAVRYLAAGSDSEKDAAMKQMIEVLEGWQDVRNLPRAVHLGRLEMERTRQNKDSLDAYRAVLVQEASR